MNYKGLALALSLFATPTTGTAEEFQVGSLVIEHPWTRSTSAVDRTGAVYLTIRNVGNTDDRLVKAKTDIAESAEIHSTFSRAGLERMRRIDGLTIHAGATMALAPSEVHVMLTGLKAPLVPGERFSLTLAFAKAGEVETRVEVLQPGDVHSGPGH